MAGATSTTCDREEVQGRCELDCDRDCDRDRQPRPGGTCADACGQTSAGTRPRVVVLVLLLLLVLLVMLLLLLLLVFVLKLRLFQHVFSACLQLTNKGSVTKMLSALIIAHCESHALA